MYTVSVMILFIVDVIVTAYAGRPWHKLCENIVKIVVKLWEDAVLYRQLFYTDL